MNILLIDDAGIIRIALRDILVRLGGYEAASIHEAATVAEALEKYAVLQPKYTFCDINLPDGNGIDIVKAVTEAHKDAHIIMCSGSDNEADVRACMAAGARGYLIKPPRAETVLQALAIQPAPTFVSSDEHLPVLKQEFLRLYAAFADELHAALAQNDPAATRRLVHTLRGSAGLIHETTLQKLAAQAEADVLNNLPATQWLPPLLAETARVLAHLAETVPKQKNTAPPPPQDELLGLLDELEKLLAANNSGALKFVDTLAFLPNSETVCNQINDFEFEAALAGLQLLRASL